jgi:hypothetical protein
VAREAMAWATGLTVVATALAFLTR